MVEAARARNLRIAAIALTHGHPDHAPGAHPLARATGAHVYAHPRTQAWHDRDLALEDALQVSELALPVINAPGHTFDHVVFYLPEERALFTGDVILGQGTVVIAPPGGAMRPYQWTLQRLSDEFPEATTIYGGHGPVVDDARGKIADYIQHRVLREQELLGALVSGPQTIPELVKRIYVTSPPLLWPAAARQMLAYLVALEEEGRVLAQPVGRAMTREETAILNPAWETIVGKEQAAVVEAELGSMLQLDVLSRYELVAPPI